MNLNTLTRELSRIAASLKMAADRKNMVIMIGGPASGKGFNTGKGGVKLPKFTQGLIADDDVAGGVTEEGDASLRVEQRMAARDHFDTLSKAKKEGKCDEALEDHWYQTKDGNKKSLGDNISCKDLPEDFDSFFEDNQKVADFYVSMRGWHDDASKTHKSPPAPAELDGKPVERFKDRARNRFDRRVQNMVEAGESDFLVLDSAGEDIDVQDFETQIAHARANGYEVTVVHLAIDPEDTKLSNLWRGAQGDRMVDESDIDNYFEKEAKELEDILETGNPDRYMRMHRVEGSLDDDDRMKARSAIASYKKARLAGADKDELKKIEKEVRSYLYRPQYSLDLENSDLVSDSYTPERVQKILEKAGKDVSKEKLKEKDRGKKDEDGEGDDKSYGGYVKRKKQKGEKPLSKEDWEVRVKNRAKAASERIRILAQRTLVAMSAMEGLESIFRDAYEEAQEKLSTEFNGYSIEFDTDEIDFYIRIKGGAAQGIRDITTLKDIRKIIEPIFEKPVKKFDKGLKVKITSSSRSDDLIIHVGIDA